MFVSVVPSVRKLTAITGLLFGLASATSSYAQSVNDLKLVTSIRPLALMQADLGLGWQEPLVPVGVTPHDFSLRASHMKRLQEADLVIWLGPEIEPYLTKIMARKPDHQQLILTADMLSEEHEEHEEHEDHQDHADHEEHADHEAHHDDHAGHDHGNLHPWTSPDFARDAMAAMVEKAVAIEPSLEADLAARWQQLETKLQQQEAQWQQYFKQHEVGYITYHDALGPYESTMSIASLGSIADESGSQSGVKNLKQIFDLIEAGKVACILVDAEANQALVSKVVAQGIEAVKIDLLAWQVKSGEDNLWRYFDGLGKSLEQCELEHSH